MNIFQSKIRRRIIMDELPFSPLKFPTELVPSCPCDTTVKSQYNEKLYLFWQVLSSSTILKIYSLFLKKSKLKNLFLWEKCIKLTPGMINNKQRNELNWLSRYATVKKQKSWTNNSKRQSFDQLSSVAKELSRSGNTIKPSYSWFIENPGA